MDHLRNSVRDQIKAALEPLGFRIGIVTPLLGGWNIIWYWGKNETSFAGGGTPEAVIESAKRQVFGGL